MLLFYGRRKSKAKKYRPGSRQNSAACSGRMGCGAGGKLAGRCGPVRRAAVCCRRSDAENRCLSAAGGTYRYAVQLCWVCFCRAAFSPAESFAGNFGRHGRWIMSVCPCGGGGSLGWAAGSHPAQRFSGSCSCLLRRAGRCSRCTSAGKKQKKAWITQNFELVDFSVLSYCL